MADDDGNAFRSSLARAEGRSPFFQLLAGIGSAPMAALLIVVVAVVTWVATYYEGAYGRDAAQVLVYQSWWFNFLFLVLGAAVLCAVVVRWPLRRHQYGFAVVHAGLLTLIAGFAIAGRDRLDGMLEAAPGREATQVELPVDYCAAVVEPAAGPSTGAATAVQAIHFQPIALAGYPSFLRYLVHPLWPVTVPGINRLDRPAPLLDLPTAGVAVAVTAVADTARFEPGRSEAEQGEPAVRVELRMRTPGQSGESRLAGRWLTPDADGGQLLVGPLASTFALARDPALARAFAQPPAQVGAGGRLRVCWQGQVHDLDLDPAQSDQKLAAGSCTVQVLQRLEHPGQREGRLVEVPEAEHNPVLRLAISVGDGDKTRRTEAWVAAGALVPPLGEGWPEFLYEHPLWLAGVGQGKAQGGVAMLLGAPDGTLHVRTATRSRGPGPAAAIAGGGGWSGYVVGDAQSPMAVGLDLRWLPQSRPGPEPVAMDPARKDRALRWVEFAVRCGGQERRAWLPRGERAALTVGGMQVLLHYDRGRLDLRRDRGFAVRLERFDEGRDPGGMRSASYASEVTVLADGGESRARITMNEPLRVGSVTLYQTAFRPEAGPDGAPTGRQMSIFTVAEDRGRWLKYGGSALIVLGMMLLWWWRPRRPAAAATPPAPTAQATP
jgi:hypothetical protein